MYITNNSEATKQIPFVVGSGGVAAGDLVSVSSGTIIKATTNSSVILGIAQDDGEASVKTAASCIVEAATAVTDILTVTGTTVIGVRANALSISLETATDDVLAVSAEGNVITIALADTTATKNTAALTQVDIRALGSVGGVDVSEFTCAAGGDWDTAAIATGETAAVSFTGGVSDIVVVSVELIEDNTVNSSFTSDFVLTNNILGNAVDISSATNVDIDTVSNGDVVVVGYNNTVKELSFVVPKANRYM